MSHTTRPVFGPNDKTRLAQAVANAYQRGKVLPLDIQYISADGLATLSQMEPQEILTLALDSLPVVSRAIVSVAVSRNPELKRKALTACETLRSLASV
ncbi:hypothetical protein OAU50_02225 [Planctomycetota bacterium]|nr:hypothetical protein [Planctomycetota bacterium]